MNFSVADHRAMAEALRLAARGLYSTQPNPRVGSVIVRDGVVIGRGWHLRAGEAHAEVLALQQAAEHARGSTVYVTLEPCAHHGRTPPCAGALIRAGVARVVAATADPNPAVAGGGLALLREAGIETASGLMQQAARELNPGYFKRHESGRPWLRVKMAMSLDGRVAMASGESQWISGAPARRDVQALRARSCALLTGIGTVLADDPRLTVRAEELPAELAATSARQPLRVVLDTALRLPLASRLLDGAALLVLTASDDDDRTTSLQQRGAEVLRLAGGGDGVDLQAAMFELGRRELNEVQVEAGPTLAGRLLRAGLVDELVLYVAPKLLGSRARAVFELPFERLRDAFGLNISEIRQLGDDLRISARPSASS